MKPAVFLILPLIMLSSACDTINQLFLKSAINSLHTSLSANIWQVLKFVLRLLKYPRVWFGFIFSLVSLCLWLYVLSQADLNLAFSLDSMHYIFIALSSKAFLREKVGIKRVSGTILIIIGITLVSLS
ncbi:MAG: hypothetical protein A3G38_01810 [Omnitrophica WOR_2 bacterium RIFCSPLOWO2_12_FULL_51_8]|nr:MAG: hypothetical protein A3G38_01810 [Omnitrophica WOR_2 bacterium RIFCSPLOWO2_12_FULL_51_8]